MKKVFILKHSDLSGLEYSYYENFDDALREFINDKLQENGFDLDSHINIVGNLNYSEFVRFEQE